MGFDLLLKLITGNCETMFFVTCCYAISTISTQGTLSLLVARNGT